MKPEVTLEEEATFAVENGKSGTFATCTAAGAKPQPDITWEDDKGAQYNAQSTTMLVLFLHFSEYREPIRKIVFFFQTRLYFELFWDFWSKN